MTTKITWDFCSLTKWLDGFDGDNWIEIPEGSIVLIFFYQINMPIVDSQNPTYKCFILWQNKILRRSLTQIKKNVLFKPL